MTNIEEVLNQIAELKAAVEQDHVVAIWHVISNPRAHFIVRASFATEIGPMGANRHVFRRAYEEYCSPLRFLRVELDKPVALFKNLEWRSVKAGLLFVRNLFHRG